MVQVIEITETMTSVGDIGTLAYFLSFNFLATMRTGSFVMQPVTIMCYLKTDSRETLPAKD